MYCSVRFLLKTNAGKVSQAATACPSPDSALSKTPGRNEGRTAQDRKGAFGCYKLPSPGNSNEFEHFSSNINDVSCYTIQVTGRAAF